MLLDEAGHSDSPDSELSSSYICSLGPFPKLSVYLSTWISSHITYPKLNLIFPTKPIVPAIFPISADG
jgi:hypothetical protein